MSRLTILGDDAYNRMEPAIIISGLINAGLLGLWLVERGRRRYYESIAAPQASLKEVLSAMSAELRKSGIVVHGILLKNKHTLSLECDKFSIPLMEANAASKCFFTIRSQPLGNTATDNEVMSTLSCGNRGVFYIPLAIEKTANCWEIRGCKPPSTPKDRCIAYQRPEKVCWLSKCKRPGEDVKSKLSGCVSCPAFIPVGIAVVTGDPSKATSIVAGHSRTLRHTLKVEKLAFTAMRDALTGCLNKSNLLPLLTVEIERAQSSGRPVSVCMFDFDHFKKFNDTYGHPEGDRLLKELTALVATHIREGDYFIRYGGEEFSIIFPGAAKAAVTVSADKIRLAVQDHIFCDDKKVTISMGVAEFPQDMDVTGKVDSGSLVSHIMNCADQSLYVSKRTRNCVTAYQAGMSVGEHADNGTAPDCAVPEKKATKKKIPAKTTSKKVKDTAVKPDDEGLIDTMREEDPSERESW